jgi:two-component system sensor histidine kinase DegS
MKTTLAKYKTLTRLLRNPYQWTIALLLIIISLLLYPQIYSGDLFTSVLGTNYYIFEPILFLIPVIYAGYILGIQAGAIVLIISILIMLPSALLFSPDLISSIFELTGVVVVGGIINIFFWINRKNSIEADSAAKALSRISVALPVAAFVINNHHKVVLWNRALEAATGIKQEEMIGTDEHWKAFYGAKKRLLADLILDGASPAEIQQNYSGKLRKSQLIEGAYEAEDHFVVTSAGSAKWLHFTASPIKDRDGKIYAVIETFEDISEQKKAEEALRESERNYRNLFESALDAIWVNDTEGNIQAANESTARLTGYSIQALCQDNIKVFLTESSLNTYRQLQERLLHGQPLNTSYEQKLVRKDGSEVICMVTTNLITHTGTTAAFQSIARDVTEEKRLYENQQYYLKEITRAQEEERKRIARELHDSTAQNLIALLHQVENMLDEKSTIPVSQAKKLWVFYERVRDILQEVRRFSRDLRPSILDDLGLMPALEWLTQELNSNHGIEATLNIVGEVRRLTTEAELLFFRIVQEALTNIEKHARASRSAVRVEFAEKKITITVTDNGIGFSPQKNVSGLVQNGKLGLAGMEERVQLLGGSLEIASEPGSCTTIRIEAPI